MVASKALPERGGAFRPWRKEKTKMKNDRLTVHILGECWTIEERGKIDDDYLEQCDGYCDKTARLIVVTVRNKNCDLLDFDAYQRKVIRHEIIHAFLFESGLHECWDHGTGHDESYVDWIAVQWPKIARAFAEVGVSD